MTVAVGRRQHAVVKGGACSQMKGRVGAGAGEVQEGERHVLKREGISSRGEQREKRSR